jgi:hypothetical protein
MHLVDPGLVLKQVVRIITTIFQAVNIALKFTTNTFKKPVILKVPDHSLSFEVIHLLNISSNIILVIKSRRTRWAGQVVRTGNRRGYTGFWKENFS